MRLLAEEGLGAEVSTAGELEFARRADIPGEHIVVDGNNKSDDEIRAASELGATLSSIPSTTSSARTRPKCDAHWSASRRGSRLRPTTRSGRPPGSKFGLPPAEALEAIRRGRIDGLHVHIGSQLVGVGAMR